MNLISTLVTIVALGSGGPHYLQHQARGPIATTTISVFRYDGSEKRPYATLYEGGELILRLRPGVYSVEASLTGGSVTPCGSAKPLRIGHRKTERVQLWCNTK
jgi:hypothetical protein